MPMKDLEKPCMWGELEEPMDTLANGRSPVVRISYHGHRRTKPG